MQKVKNVHNIYLYKFAHKADNVRIALRYVFHDSILLETKAHFNVTVCEFNKKKMREVIDVFCIALV